MTAAKTVAPVYVDAFQKQAPRLPGRLFCAYYDRGGEGVAYHDAADRNQGSGELNPDDGSYLNGFRSDESVGTSYTKAGGVDDHEFNRVDPPMGLLYVGWTEPGNWLRYTVVVERPGFYAASLLYTCPRGGAIGLDIDDFPRCEEIDLPTTYDGADPVVWRQPHHWALFDGIQLGWLSVGVHALTLRTLRQGGMNYAWLDFRRADQR